MDGIRPAGRDETDRSGPFKLKDMTPGESSTNLTLPDYGRVVRHSGTIRPYDHRAIMSDGFSMVRECRRARPIGRYSSEGMM